MWRGARANHIFFANKFIRGKIIKALHRRYNTARTVSPIAVVLVVLYAALRCVRARVYTLLALKAPGVTQRASRLNPVSFSCLKFGSKGAPSCVFCFCVDFSKKRICFDYISEELPR